MSNYIHHVWSDDMIEKTIKTFKPDADRLGQDFTREDAVESLNNMTVLFEILMELDQKQRKEELPKLLTTLKRIESVKATQYHR